MTSNIPKGQIQLRVQISLVSLTEIHAASSEASSLLQSYLQTTKLRQVTV